MLLDALLDGAPDGLVLCDALLRPLRASAAARGHAVTCAPDHAGDGVEWARTTLAEACREAAALALDRAGIASLRCELDGTTWEVRAAPLDDDRFRVCLVLRPTGALERETRETVVRAAHDLKAPLHAIAGFGALLQRQQLGPLNASQREAVATLVGESERLRSALTALVERVRTGDPTAACSAPATCGRGADLRDAARESAQRFAALAAATGVTLEVASDTTDLPLLTALPRLDAATILDNLVTNALATRPTTIRLVLAPGAPGMPGMATVRVEDDGPGIPEDSLERIFAPRVRLEDRGAPGGCGLGLTIARALAVRAGGTLTAAQRPGGGAAFTLRVPTADPDAPHTLRVAPVTSHAALARAQAALDGGGTWRHVAWDEGVLTVALDARDEPRTAAALAGAGLTCW